jgi:hypothetical protein
MGKFGLQLMQASLNSTQNNGCHMGFCASAAGRCKHQQQFRYWASVPGWTLVIGF